MRALSRKDQVAALVREGLSRAQIRDQIPGLSAETIRDYCRDALRTMTETERAAALAKRAPASSAVKGGQLRWDTRQPLSPLHRRVGIRLAEFRQREGLNVTRFCELYGFANRMRVSALEAGLVEPSLSELVTLAGLMGTDVVTLLSPVTPAWPALAA